MPRKKKDEYKKVSDDIIDNVFKNDDLTEKEKDFILYYLQSFNATQSYLKAYGGDKKYAGTNAHFVKNRPRVKNEIIRLKKAMADKLDIDPTEYVKYNMKVAYADLGDYMNFKSEEVPETDVDGSPVIDENGNQKMRKVSRLYFKDSNEVDTSILSKVSMGRDGLVLSLPDKGKAWENLAKYFKWGEQKEEKEVSNNLLSALEKSTKSVWSENEEDNEKDWKEATSVDR